MMHLSTDVAMHQLLPATHLHSVELLSYPSDTSGLDESFQASDYLLNEERYVWLRWVGSSSFAEFRSRISASTKSAIYARYVADEDHKVKLSNESIYIDVIKTALIALIQAENFQHNVVDEPFWLERVTRRIELSTAGLSESTENGDAISAEVASSAKVFLKIFSRYFADEPYIYASKSGDLVAEFQSRHRTTAVIAPDALVLFHAGDKPISAHFEDWKGNFHEVERFIQSLQ